MAKYFRTVTVQIEFQDNMTDDGDSTPTGPGMTTPITELNKIIADGCGDSFTQEKHYTRGDYEVIYVIEGV